MSPFLLWSNNLQQQTYESAAELQVTASKHKTFWQLTLKVQISEKHWPLHEEVSVPSGYCKFQLFVS